MAYEQRMAVDQYHSRQRGVGLYRPSRDSLYREIGRSQEAKTRSRNCGGQRRHRSPHVRGYLNAEM